MLIKIRSGFFEPSRGDIEPSGAAVWTGGVGDEVPASALEALNGSIQPGTWYSFEEFSRLVAEVSLETSDNLASAVIARQSGVSNEWNAVIEINQGHAALMLCRSVIEYAEQLEGSEDLWIRVE